VHVQFVAVESTDLFVGTADSPRQVLRVTAERSAARPVPLAVAGRGISGSAEVPAGDGRIVVEVALEITADVGDFVPVTVIAEHPDWTVTTTGLVTVERPGYTMYMVSHFHYDPVWWNTQAAYTSSWEWLSGDGTTRPMWEHNGFALVDAHLDLALRDPDYRFVLAEIDYLKPYFDIHPERKSDLKRLLAEGRVELLGGTYNEPNTNLTGAELTIRNIVYGVGYQREILGGEPSTAWQLDAFGHDPQFPGYLAAAGLTASAWARGPFHQWGPMLTTFGVPKGDATVMQFPSEFEWIAPSGLGVLTHYMPNHYSSGWEIDSASTLDDAERATYALYSGLKPVAATRALLLPVGTDYTPPNKWITAIHREWNAKYVWPRFICGTPRDFLDAVRADFASSGTAPTPQTRDMNPLYTGKDVSYIDTKQAQRAGEIAATDAEKLATMAVLLGLGSYPEAALDKVWRQLAYGAHHDAITGSESDQVYLDLLSGWREAYDLADGVRHAALHAIAGRIDTSGADPAIIVANTLSFDRSDLVRVRVDGPVRIVDEVGAVVASVVERGELVFRADGVPALGWRTYRLEAHGFVRRGWTIADGVHIENEHLRVVADPARGGTLASIVLRESGRELLLGAGNELRVYDEYAQHPQWGEGPWHLLPRGTFAGSADRPAEVDRLVSDLGERLVITGEVDGVRYEQSVTLWRGLDRVDFRTRVVDFEGENKLLRVRFPAGLPGALPISEVASAVVGRGYALPDIDTALAPWTLDNPANTWFGLGSTARVRLVDPRGAQLGMRAVGIAELVVPSVETASLARDVAVALARAGVTATTSAADWPRYGLQSIDSNLPDVRIALGGQDQNAFTQKVLDRAAPEVRAEFQRQLDQTGQAMLWVNADKPLPDSWIPNADLRDVRALPTLIIAGEQAIGALIDDLADARVTAVSVEAPTEPLTDGTVALLTYGLPGFAVDTTGALHLSLMRSSTGWPSGVWIDPPKRTVPDGSSFQLQHWTHEFSYALVAGDGDWRELTLPARGQEYSTPLLAELVEPHGGELPASCSLLRVEPQRDVLLSALKPTGNPIAVGSGAAVDAASSVTIRLAESTGLGGEVSMSGDLIGTVLTRADLLERPTGSAEQPLRLDGFEVATVLVRPELAPISDATSVLGPTAELAQPVFSRYWLHNRGPAPMGFLPVSIAVTPGLLRADGGPVDIEVVLANQLSDTEHEGVVTLRVPDGWQVEPASRVYRLASAGYTRFTATVTPVDAAAGMYFVAASTEQGGQLIEDVATIVVGDAAGALPVPGPIPHPRLADQGTTATTARETGLDVDVVKPELVVRVGKSAEFEVVLTNATADEIRGEIQLVSPWGTWDCVGEPTRGFRVLAGQRSVVALPIQVPSGSDPAHAWILAKVMWFGRCQYSPTIRFVIDDGS
jgi:alpha-mannosidase